jgi:uncharacterized membrane protein
VHDYIEPKQTGENKPFRYGSSCTEHRPALNRLESIDLMRGLVMALMALDHTRDFFSNVPFHPTDLSQTTAALFLTRWITHFCAPTFVFLTGVSAYLSTVRHHLTSLQLAWYLLTRGVWLIVLELTLVRFGWSFNWSYHDLYGAVIWALGWSMIILAGLIFLPRWAIGLFALVSIAGHNLFDAIQPADIGGAWSGLWTVLHVPGRIEYLPGYSFSVIYPLIPWVGVMAAGYGLAPVFLWAPKPRKTLLVLLGFVLVAIFLVLRLNNIYGDQPWVAQKDSLFTLFAILNCGKYPPSLLYLLMTLGPMLLGLVLFESSKLHQFSRPLLAFGRVPLFFYLIHLMLIHGTALVVILFRDMPIDWLHHGFGFMPNLPAPEYGYNLVTVYAVWLLMLLLLYPLCHVYARFKQQHPEIRWLAYL